MSAIRLCVFNFTHATAAEWEGFLAIDQIMTHELDPADPVIDPVVRRQGIEAMSRDPVNNFLRYVALQGAAVVGLLTLNLPVQNDQHTATMSIYVVPNKRRQGIGRLLLKQAAAECHARQITVLQGESRTAAGNAFASAAGGMGDDHLQENRLQMADVNWAWVDRWIAGGARQNPGVTIETFAGLISDDDAEIARHARLYTEIVNQEPYAQLAGTDREYTAAGLRFEDEEHTRIGVTLWTKIAREADGTLSGLTEISYHPEWGGRVVQGMTGVREAYRKRGLGKWLKADMLAFIRQTYPDVTFISTTNANMNAPMRSINDRLGFRFYKQLTLYKLNVADLLPRLAAI